MTRIPAITPQGVIIGWWHCIKAPEPSRGDPRGLWEWHDAGETGGA